MNVNDIGRTISFPYINNEFHEPFVVKNRRWASGPKSSILLWQITLFFGGNEKSLYLIFECSIIWVPTKKSKKRGIFHEKDS